MLANIFIFWIAILPFITWKGFYETPKVLVFLVGGLGVFSFWIYRVLIKKQNIEFSKTDLYYILWLAVLIVASIFGVHPFESLVGGSYRHQGVIFFLVLWTIGKTVSILPKDKKKLLFKMLSLAILVESLIVIFQVITGHVYFGKPLGTLGEANAVAGFLAIGSSFLYQYFPKLFVLVPLLSIILTQSRAGLLSMLTFSGIFVSDFRKEVKKILWPLLMALMVILILVFSINKRISVFESRTTFWKLGVSQILQKPVFGYGAESGEVVYNTAFYQSGFPLSNLIVDRSHNLFIDVAIWSGIVGLILFIFWLIQKYKSLDSIPRKLAFLSFLVYSMFQPLSIVHWILFFLII